MTITLLYGYSYLQPQAISLWCLFFFVVCFSLCLKLLCPLLPNLWQLCVLVHSHHYDYYNGSYCCGPISIGSAWCGSATTIDTKGQNKRFCWPCHCTSAGTTSVTDIFSGLCQLCHGSSSGEISLSEFSLPSIHYVCVCYSVCFLLSGSHVAAMFTNGGSTIEVCIITTLWSITLEGICASW